MKLISNISSILLAFIIGFVQLLPVKWDKEKPFYNLEWVIWIDNHSILVVAICCSLIVVITIVCAIIDKIKGKKKWLKSVLREMIDNYLYGQNYHTRITVFKINWNNTYLKCYSRFGYPPNLCPTPRDIPISQYGRYEGVVGKCLAEGTWVECHAKSIDDIQFAKKLEKNVPQNKARIKAYMDATFISDYNILRKMHRKSTHFYAYPIAARNADIWGVLIIDNDDSKSYDFEQIKPVIKAYSDIISLTLNI